MTTIYYDIHCIYFANCYRPYVFQFSVNIADLRLLSSLRIQLWLLHVLYILPP